MDFELNDDELALQEAVRRFCQERFPVAISRSLENGDRARWRELGELGVFDLLVPHEDGGAGLGVVEGVLVFEELGRALVPGPLLGCFLAAAVVPGIAAADVVVTVIERPTSGPALIEHLAIADAVMIVDEHGVWQVNASELFGAAVDVQPLDPTSVVGVVARLPQGNQVGGPEMAQRWCLLGSLLTSAMLVGNATATLEMAVEYAKNRFQFDRPIGSFQAIKHLVADMLARAEVSRASLYAAAATVDDPEVGDVERAVAGARVLAGRSAIENGKTCIQVHGGMGFTWEAVPHLFAKRAWTLAATFGSVDAAAEAVAIRLPASSGHDEYILSGAAAAFGQPEKRVGVEVVAHLEG